MRSTHRDVWLDEALRAVRHQENEEHDEKVVRVPEDLKVLAL